MAAHESKPERLPARGDRFATTHWSMVVSAGAHRGEAGAGRSPEASRALAMLCENYWFPLYAFVRRAGYSAEDAQDLTQEFFVRLLTKNYLAVADPQRGRFRSFLLGAMKHFLANEERRQGAQKRGGHRPMMSLDFHSGENRYSLIEPVDNSDPRAAVRETLGADLAGPRAQPAPRGVSRRRQVGTVRSAEAVSRRWPGKGDRSNLCEAPGGPSRQIGPVPFPTASRRISRLPRNWA